jgi:transcriptional regulator with XRE-family HTH domain
MTPSFAAQIGDAIRTARSSAQLTQAKLAEAAGVSDETVSRIERGAYEPAVSTMIALADALGVSLDVLTGRAGANDDSSAKRFSSPLIKRLAERAAKLGSLDVQLLLRVADSLPLPPPQEVEKPHGKRGARKQKPSGR